MITRKWPVWRIVKIGLPGFSTAEEFLSALKQEEIAIGRYVELAIQAMIPGLVRVEKEIALTFVRASDFGFSRGSFLLGDLLPKIRAEGLDTNLPFETGPRFLLQHRADCDKLHMAVKHVMVAGYGPCGLFLCENGMSGDCVDPGVSLDPGFTLVCGVS